MNQTGSVKARLAIAPQVWGKARSRRDRGKDPSAPPAPPSPPLPLLRRPVLEDHLPLGGRDRGVGFRRVIVAPPDGQPSKAQEGCDHEGRPPATELGEEEENEGGRHRRADGRAA